MTVEPLTSGTKRSGGHSAGLGIAQNPASSTSEYSIPHRSSSLSLLHVTKVGRIYWVTVGTHSVSLPVIDTPLDVRTPATVKLSTLPIRSRICGAQRSKFGELWG